VGIEEQLEEVLHRSELGLLELAGSGLHRPDERLEVLGSESLRLRRQGDKHLAPVEGIPGPPHQLMGLQAIDQGCHGT
jgi:hypothetical protein